MEKKNINSRTHGLQMEIASDNNMGQLSWFDLAKGYCKHQVGGYQGEMGARLCGYLESSVGYFSKVDQYAVIQMPQVSSQGKNERFLIGDTDIFAYDNPMSDLPNAQVPYSEYTKNLFERLEKSKNIEVSEEEKTFATLESLSKNYKNNIQYDKEKIATKLDLYTTNLEALNRIVFRAYPPEVTPNENVKLDKLTGIVQALKSQRNNIVSSTDDTGDEVVSISLAEELKDDMHRFQELIAPLSSLEREEHTSMITKVARIIKKLEILTPLLDAYVLIFLLRNSRTSERALAYTKELLAFLSDPLHSSQLRLEPELTRLIEVTMQTKLTHLLRNTSIAVQEAISSLSWIMLSYDHATPVLHRAVHIRTSVLTIHKAGEGAVFFQTLDEGARPLHDDFIAARQHLDTSVIRLQECITNMSNMRKDFKHALVAPAVVAGSYFIAGFMEGRYS